jgi:GxxExxY protein
MSASQRVYLEERLTRSVIAAFYRIYTLLGYGFLEGVYAAALERELRRRGHRVRREVGVRVYCDGVAVAWQRIDMIVDDVLIVEIKSTAELSRAARRQLLNYLSSTRLEIGLLLHFGPRPKVHRYVSSNVN